MCDQLLEFGDKIARIGSRLSLSWWQLVPLNNFPSRACDKKSLTGFACDINGLTGLKNRRKGNYLSQSSL